MKPGKRTKYWLKIRREWVKNNPPNHEGAYLCAICLKPVHYSVMTLHHVMGRKGSLLSNVEHLVPTHESCNNNVGSKRGVRNVSPEEYAFRRTLDI